MKKRFNKLSGFNPNGTSNIPLGVYFTYVMNEEGKKVTAFDENGELETVNPMIAIPTKFDDKTGLITNANENFQSQSYLFESDELTIRQQIIQARRLVSLGVINKVVYSGGKSLHMRCTVHEDFQPRGAAERKWLFFHIIESYGIKKIDPVCYNQSRMIRREDVVRPDTGKLQELIHLSDDILAIEWHDAFAFDKQWIEDCRGAFKPARGQKPQLMAQTLSELSKWTTNSRKIGLLQDGLVPKMMMADMNIGTIKSALNFDKCNEDIQFKITKDIRNMKTL